MSSPPRDKEATIWEHLEELAYRLRRALIAFAIVAVILSLLPASLVGGAGAGARFFYKPLVLEFPTIIFKHIVPPTIRALDGNVYNVTVMPERGFESVEVIGLSVLLLGLVGASPFIARELWAYIEPALYSHEKKFLQRYSVLFALAFVFGVFFAIYIVAPLVMRMVLALYPWLVPHEYLTVIRVSVKEVLGFALKLSIAFGLFFDLPVALYLLLAYGVLDPELFGKDAMKYILVGSMIAGAIVSPDPSGVGMLAIGLSLYLPMHVAITLGKKRALERRRMEEVEAKAVS
jgi:sec-independent protein translocase protein TatC